LAVLVVAFVRPIPAGAGETADRSGRAGHPRAYPRGRGGNQAETDIPDRLYGLSPRARGKPVAAISARLLVRPIPAGAGETCCGEA